MFHENHDDNNVNSSSRNYLEFKPCTQAHSHTHKTPTQTNFNFG